MDAATNPGAGTLRSATPADAGALLRLYAALGIEELRLGAADVAASLDRGPLIVLDIGGGTLGAAAHISLDQANHEMHARLELLVIHPALAGSGVEDRMGVALLAICEASGWADLDVGSPEPRRCDSTRGSR